LKIRFSLENGGNVLPVLNPKKSGILSSLRSLEDFVAQKPETETAVEKEE
jgi:hypothetical protein